MLLQRLHPANFPILYHEKVKMDLPKLGISYFPWDFHGISTAL
jgi:hypothetical protein